MKINYGCISFNYCLNCLVERLFCPLIFNKERTLAYFGRVLVTNVGIVIFMYCLQEHFENE